MTQTTSGLLAGFTIVEVGHFVAAPFAARVLADHGATVIKVEPPAGDPVRQWGAQVDGHSLWWSVHGRNKQCVTLDLKSPEGHARLLELVQSADGLIENFRPGQLERLGIGPDVLRQRNPDLVIARISGYGQTGPYRDRAAFGVIGEAMGGLRHLTNHAPSTSDLPPVRVGVSIGDSIAGLYAAFGLVAGLLQRRTGGSGPAATIDVALTEAVFSMMEAMLPEYGALGIVKQPTGGAIATAAPSNAYPTRDGAFVLIAANSDPLFERLKALIGNPALDDAAFVGNRARVAAMARLDALIGAWTQGFDTEALIGKLEAADIPSCKVFTVEDCARDPQYAARGMVRREVDPLLGEVLHPGVVPHVEGHEGAVRWTGRAIGADNAEVFGTADAASPAGAVAGTDG